jgi:hypothetical protein
VQKWNDYDAGDVMLGVVGNDAHEKTDYFCGKYCH